MFNGAWRGSIAAAGLEGTDNRARMKGLPAGARPARPWKGSGLVKQKVDRRALLTSAAATTAGALGSGPAGRGAQSPAGGEAGGGLPATGAPAPYLPVECPDVPKLPWELVDGVKVFRLRAEPLKR